VKSFLIPIGVAVVGLLAGAAVAGQPSKVPHDIARLDVPAVGLTTTTAASRASSASTTSTTAVVVAPTTTFPSAPTSP
jgi:hypothetical protein